MKNGIKRFEFYLIQLEKLFTDAAKEKNPAFWLYSNNARTTLFMLESLAKLYSGLHDKKKFSKIDEHFKQLEDAIGAIDYYDSFAKEFIADIQIPAGVTDYAQAQSRESIQRLNDILIENGWIGEKADRMQKIRKKLNDADWLKEKDEVKAIEDYYKKQIIEINNFYKEYSGGFTEVETQVHALRRKLRWLSIYPQSLQGCIQLDQTEAPNDEVTKYLTPEIVNSKFNIMPDAGEAKYLLMLNKNYFLALSWIISELGKLKDKGLRVLLVIEALQQTKNISHEDAVKETNTILAVDTQKLLSEILSTASGFCQKYFSEKNLDKLLVGISKTKVSA